MMKLALLAFLAMCAVVVSSPINEEKRTDEIVDLLRELLHVDMEDEYRLQNAKRGFGSFAAEPSIDPAVYTTVVDMWSQLKYSFVVLRIITNKWEVVGTGSPLAQGLTPSKATLEGVFNEMKGYLTSSQATLVLFKRGTTRTMNNPYAVIEWLPERVPLRTKMTYITNIPPLMDHLQQEASMRCYEIYWATDDDINYDNIFIDYNN